jgi:hypothetical protein
MLRRIQQRLNEGASLDLIMEKMLPQSHEEALF